MNEKNKCPLCESSRIKNLGRIPECGEFAGNSSRELEFLNTSLFKCLDCESLYRYPTLTSHEYTELYKSAPSDVWSKSTIKRIDSELIRTALISSPKKSKILDVGCYAGSFLETLPDNFRKFGIEPSKEAANEARKKNINILAEKLEYISSNERFDVIVCIDIVEHLVDLKGFLDKCLEHLSEEGTLYISTGDPNCKLWLKAFKSRYWYCSYSEHIVFPSAKFFMEFCSSRNISETSFIKHKYCERSLIKSLVLIITQLLFYFSPKIYRLSEAKLRLFLQKQPRLNPNFGIMCAGVIQDHQIIIINKRNKK
jgi:ubiquinone/menaquinone biosynthesis C-methylase UbiE